MDAKVSMCPGHIINYETIEKFLWSEIRMQVFQMRGGGRLDFNWDEAYSCVHSRFIKFLKVDHKWGRRAQDEVASPPRAPYYTGFFVTVIGEAYARGEGLVQLTPEHVAVLKDMLKDYGMLECRRARKDPECALKRRACDFAAKFEECRYAED